METRTTSVPTGGTAVIDAPKQAANPGVGKGGRNKGIHRAVAVNAVAAVVATPMTAAEQTALVQLEQTIQEGLKTFLAVGDAMIRIRDERLYRVDHPTFEAYCRERWGFSKTQANRLIAASSVAKNLAPIGVTPTSESQVRLLASLPAEKQVKVFERAAKESGGTANVTAAAIQHAAEKMRLRTSPAASNVSAPSSTTNTRPDSNYVKRKDVVKALTEWAHESWEKASKMSEAEFVKAVKHVIEDI